MLQHEQQLSSFLLGTYMKARGTNSDCADAIFNCPGEATLSVIGGKWKVVALLHLSHSGIQHFAELRRKGFGVSERKVTQQLWELEHDGAARQVVYSEVSAKVECSLTASRETLRPICELMCSWGSRT